MSAWMSGGGGTAHLSHWCSCPGLCPCLNALQVGKVHEVTSYVQATFARRDPILRATTEVSQRYSRISQDGFWVSQCQEFGCDTPPANFRCEIPGQRGISDSCATPMKVREIGHDPSSAILSLKGRMGYGGVSQIGPLSLVLNPNLTTGSVSTHMEAHWRGL